MKIPQTRRQWLKTTGLAGAAGMLCSTASVSPAAASGLSSSENSGYKTYFGDLHNHSAYGYARGSLQRAFNIARSHLDFCAFTPHGFWNDIAHYENSIETKWLDGFEVTRDGWPDFIKLIDQYHRRGEFVVIPGFEWHSTNLGDYHILFPDTEAAEYSRFKDLKKFQEFARRKGAIMIPHHPANRLGHRGTDFRYRDPDVSPVLEIFSEWGNAEHDRAPSPYIRHTEGGRWTQNTMQHLLAQGYRFGVVASTDDHLGFPGAYREGLAAVKAADLSRKSIFEAIRARRTYAVSGDRILLDFNCNGNIMGSELDHTPERSFSMSVEGWDQLDRVELLKNNRVIKRDFPMDRIPDTRSWDKPVLTRFEYGWGPWPALDMTRVCDWVFTITIENGKLERYQPCFQSGPLEEERLDQVLSHDEQHIKIKSFTALRQQFEDFSTKAVVMKIVGGPETKIKIQLDSPTRVNLTMTLSQLAESNEMLFTGDFPKESAMLHRLVFQDNYKSEFSFTDKSSGKEDNWYYLRATQANEQYAWSSPIWINGE